MTFYKASKWDSTITPVEVVRETESCVFIKRAHSGREIRHAKSSDYDVYFPTVDMAAAYLVERYTIRVDSLRVELSKAESELAKLTAIEAVNL